ncbi:MAG: serine--tRNA ligase [Oscillospiraceae bacterium]|nr:serine--tRNA ligase [Oscillospiraceae bacterium]
MLDINFIRNNPETVKQAAKNKLIGVDIDRLLILDAEIRKNSADIDLLRNERNSLSKLNKGGNSEEITEKVKKIKQVLFEKETCLENSRKEFNQLMLIVPSVPAPGVPIGKDESDNVEIRRWGDIPKFDFEPKDHMELAESLDLIDVPRAVKFAGSRAYFLKNEGMLLELAVCRYVLDKLVSKNFVPMSVPFMVKDTAMQGTGYFPIGYDQSYKLQEDNLFLIGTSEVSLISYHQNEILDYSDLPKKYAGYSTCFRREAGAAGKDTRGLYRVHQFQKIEQIIICRNDVKEAEELHYQILNNVEEILQSLKLPYRVALACTGEIGIGQIRKHEVETWMPSRQNYCETHSCSTMGDFQARRSNIKYRDTDGSTKFVFTLNNTGIASPRILIPILENYQQKDGSVLIPDVLQPYMNGQKIISTK